MGDIDGINTGAKDCRHKSEAQGLGAEHKQRNKWGPIRDVFPRVASFAVSDLVGCKLGC